MPLLQFRLNGPSHLIQLQPERAPKTISALVDSLPARIDIHCAKIAGKHIFWHAPFVAELEGSHDIMTLPAGTFVYWPERQFLELIYGDLQAEKAQVNVLGHLLGEISWLQTFGRTLIECHGRRIVWADLAASEEAKALGAHDTPEIPAALQFLRDARIAAWAGVPGDVKRLLSKRGDVLPFGPLAMAESELRKLHELLWRVHTGKYGLEASESVRLIEFLLQACVDRVEGFCGMTETGALLCRAASTMRNAKDLARPALLELVLYTGRMAAWLDLHICWNDANECTLAALSDSQSSGELTGRIPFVIDGAG
jgi:hypothetical protein